MHISLSIFASVFLHYIFRNGIAGSKVNVYVIFPDIVKFSSIGIVQYASLPGKHDILFLQRFINRELVKLSFFPIE